MGYKLLNLTFLVNKYSSSVNTVISKVLAGIPIIIGTVCKSSQSRDISFFSKYLKIFSSAIHSLLLHADEISPAEDPVSSLSYKKLVKIYHR